jgi:hypothetical protein
MTVLEPITMAEAETAVAVANTPIFLARRLRENQAVRRALQLHGPAKIFAALESIAPRKPYSLTDATKVYFYLVALSFDMDLLWLQRARKLAVPHIKWFSEVGDFLASGTVSTTKSSITAPAIISTPHIIRSSVANNSTVRDLR